jgi:hypothetical protein
MFPELLYCSSRGILPEVYFVNNLITRPFGELIFLTHDFEGVGFWGLGFEVVRDDKQRGDKARDDGARGDKAMGDGAKSDKARGDGARGDGATRLYTETRNI